MSEKKFKFSLRWIITIFISCVGCFILSINIGKLFFAQSIDAADLFRSEKIAQEYAEALSSGWMWAFIGIALVLLAINLLTLIKKKNDDTANITFVPVVFSFILLLTGAFWGYTFSDTRKQATDMIIPKECLSEHFNEKETSSILKDLESVGFYNPKDNFRYYLNHVSHLPLIEIQDENGTAITSFASRNSYNFEEIYSELGLVDECNSKWIVSVKDGQITDISLEWNEDTYFFMQAQTLTANPNGIYYFHHMITNSDNYNTITHSAETQIAEKHSADVEAIHFTWSDCKQDVLNTTLDSWKIHINGTYEIDGETYEVQVVAKSRTDEELAQATAEGENIPFSWWIVE